LQELEREESRCLNVQVLSRRGGIPLLDCLEVLERLHNAGIVDAGAGQAFALRQPLESLTALEIIQAIWTEVPKKAPAFQMLMSPAEGALRKTLEVVGRIHRNAIPVHEGTWN